MRLKLLLGVLLLVLPMPALADVTARYTSGAKDQIVFEIDDGGSSRISVGETVAILHIDGVDYVAVSDPSGEMKVTRAAEALDMMLGQLGSEAPKMPSATVMLTAGSAENVGGYAGMVWNFSGQSDADGKPTEPKFDVVMSGDPRLAPVGATIRHLIELLHPVMDMMIAGGNFSSTFTELFAKGTPIRVGPLVELASVDTADIPASRFELPGDVMEPMEFFTAIMPADGSAPSLPPLP